MTASPSTPKRDEHILVENVVKRFGDFTALTDINMNVRHSHIAVIIGGSGAGKTTLLKILIGLERATDGHIYVNGEDIVPMKESQLAKVRQKFGMVFQYSALLDSMNVLDNVAFPLREHTKMREKEIRAKVTDKLQALGLQNVEYKMPSELSGGMKKRVGLARALMLDPEVLMYDEPTSGLDPISSRMVDELIVETRDRYGVTSVVISHDMAGALRIADEIYLMSKGGIAISGSPSELVRGKSELAQKFFESSGIAAEALIQDREGPNEVAYHQEGS